MVLTMFPPSPSYKQASCSRSQSLYTNPFSSLSALPPSPPHTTDEEEEDLFDDEDFFSDTMSQSSSNAASNATFPMSVLVLLPDSAHSTQLEYSASKSARPSPLTTRQSGSTVPVVPSGSRDDMLVDLAAQSRRLSLAPGMGAGTQTIAEPAFGHLRSTTVPSPVLEVSDDQSTPTQAAVPAFGAKKPLSASRSPRRRPQTAAVPGSSLVSNIGGRASVALGGGMSGANGSKSRPGWEGDEVVGVLRANGLEVTVIRHASHLPTILSGKAESPTYPTFATPRPVISPSSAQSVVLVPLGDSPTLPSLSLLLAQGTTPTAVCFQQDLLDRARRVEDEWLPAAVESIRSVVVMRDRSAPLSEDSTSDLPVVLAYSANPALSASAISACVGAGAAGVLKPPYDLDTARLLHRMVAAARQGRISSVVGLANISPSPASPLMFSGPFGDAVDPKVILTPTALSRGAEHEGEKVLSAAVAVSGHKRAMSGQIGGRSISPGMRINLSATPRHSESKETKIEPALSTASSTSIVTPMSTQHPRTDMPSPPDADRDAIAAAATAFDPTQSPRRRSIDTGGLALALKRAARRFESTPVAPVMGNNNTTAGFEFPATPKKPRNRLVAGDEEQAATEGKGKAMFAELLGLMYRETMSTIDVQMAGAYDSLVAPVSAEYRRDLLERMATWDFKPHQLNEADLFRCACLIFEAVLNIEGVAELEIQLEQMNRLLFAIRAIYHAPNPYHNYVHAIDVLQATYSFLVSIGLVPHLSFLIDRQHGAPAWKRPTNAERPPLGMGTKRAREILRPQDVLGVLIAAMGHDVGHPGLSNAFMKNAKTPLSQVYEDKSVLENMHCMLVVQLLRKHGFGFLLGSTSFSSDDLRGPGRAARAAIDSRNFRQVLYSSILATDMSLHFAWIQDLKEFDEAMRAPNVAEREEVIEEDRIMLCQALIKCADISNPTRPIDVSEHWSTVLLDEWAKQASLEQELNLPVSVIGYADARLQAKGQVGFIDLFTQPLFEATSDALPELQAYADSCAENRNIWQSRLDSLEEDKSGAPLPPVTQTNITPSASDDRFRTLFPLSLPPSIAAVHIEPTQSPGSTLAPLSISTSSNSVDLSSPARSPATAIQVVPPTPGTKGETAAVSRERSVGSENAEDSESAAQVMRTVYYANLAERVHPVVLPGLIGIDGARRMSHPDPLFQNPM